MDEEGSFMDVEMSCLETLNDGHGRSIYLAFIHGQPNIPVG